MQKTRRLKKLIDNKPALLFVLLIAIFPLTEAQIANTLDNTTAINSIGTAQSWGLTEQEWTHYKALMQGVNGHWYPQLSPPAVLGINATSPQEQQHFAQLVAKDQHDKLARELSFDAAVHQALQPLYPAEPAILPFNKTAFNPAQTPTKNVDNIQVGDHLLLFISLQPGWAGGILPPLLAAIEQNPGTVLDIYCQGDTHNAAIQTWAKLNRIPVDLVATGRITLNQDTGQLQKRTPNVPLPYLLRLRNGTTKPVSIWNLP